MCVIGSRPPTASIRTLIVDHHAWSSSATVSCRGHFPELLGARRQPGFSSNPTRETEHPFSWNGLTN